MVFIYALMSGEEVLYVGKTGNLKMREYNHRCKKSNKCSSKNIPEDTVWTMMILEETTDEIGTDTEQYYYDLLEPQYNYQRPGQTHEESMQKYYQSDAGKASKKAYDKSDARKAYQKAYRERIKAAKL